MLAMRVTPAMEPGITKWINLVERWFAALTQKQIRRAPIAVGTGSRPPSNTT